MATPGFPPPFGTPPGPNTATPSEADIDPGVHFLSHSLEGTRRIVTLSPEQLPTLTPQECQSLSLGESVLLPLLCSNIHALNSIGLRLDELHSRMHDRGSQVANSLSGPEIRDLRNSVSDLSCRVAPPVLQPTPSSSAPPPPSNPNPGRHSRPSGSLPPAVPRNIPPQTAASPPTLHMPMSSMVAPANLIRLLLRMLLPVGAMAKAKSLSLLPLPPNSRPSLRLPYPRVLPLSPVQ